MSDLTSDFGSTRCRFFRVGPHREGLNVTVDPVFIPLARVVITPGAVRRVSNGPFGGRIIASVASGRWDGTRLAGTVVGAGGDWAVTGASGASKLDARQVVETDDGATIYITYNGRGDSSRNIYTVAPTFETGDERYAWINLVQALGRGRIVDGESRVRDVRSALTTRTRASRLSDDNFHGGTMTGYRRRQVVPHNVGATTRLDGGQTLIEIPIEIPGGS